MRSKELYTRNLECLSVIPPVDGAGKSEAFQVYGKIKPLYGGGSVFWQGEQPILKATYRVWVDSSHPLNEGCSFVWNNQTFEMIAAPTLLPGRISLQCFVMQETL